MKKLILRWVGLAIFLTVVALVCWRLGEWQLHRLEERREANHAQEVNQQRPPVPYREHMGGEVSDDDQWQQVVITGTYAPDQYQVRYRNVDSQPGIEVVAVMATTEGDHVLVNRGFIPRQSGQPDTEVLPEPPPGEVEITGYLRRSERGSDEAIVPHENKIRLINAPAIAAQRGEDVLDGYVNLISSTPEDSANLVPITPPPLGEGNHFSYALQWYAFGAIALVGIAVMIRADIADRKKAKAKAARKAQRMAQQQQSGDETSGHVSAE